jgi:pyruvate kinase
MTEPPASAPDTSAPGSAAPATGGTSIRQVLAHVEALRDRLRDARSTDPAVHPDHVVSAENLTDYLVLRTADLRDLQRELSVLGLSSLGRSEAHVRATVEAVLAALRALAATHETVPVADDYPPVDEGGRILQANADALLGPAGEGKAARIMVTMPSEAAHDEAFAAALVGAGMDIARINCAHDDADAWRAMAVHVRRAAQRHGRPVRIFMDLAGPKLRTGAVRNGPAVLKLRPRRDSLGRVLEPARATLSSTPAHADGVVVPCATTSFLAELAPGDDLRLTDARGSRRRLVVTAALGGSVTVEARKTTYLAPGIELHHPQGAVTVGPLPQVPGALRLHVGDVLALTADDTEAVPSDAVVPGTLGISCTLPEAVAALRPGHRVFFDDGRIGGIVESVVPGAARVRITAAAPGGSRLRAEKGINLPDTTIGVPALTDKDRTDLAVAAEIADMVALSFVRVPADVELLLGELDRVASRELGMVLKIETVQAFNNLPELLQTALRARRVGVMIARGDLAVEAGYERLAEVQEEILWLCEAAHLPVIWATEVLDTLARTGRPSRAEITDAAMAERAECVMLNKGPHIVLAIRTLDDILRRMSGHQRKKRALLRELRSWNRIDPQPL